MAITSYAQNFEDVILWRAVGDVENGFYVDLGAQHPIFDSVSKAFYDHGWRGVHVEPLREFADLLREHRPDERVFEAVVSDEPGLHRLYGIPGSGLSTVYADIAREHQTRVGIDPVEHDVPSLTLDTLFESSAADQIHWLKIDVEGHELQVISSWRGDTRPWVVLVEATLPNTRTDSFAEWEPLLLAKGYRFVYEDALNRYYLHEGRDELRDRFRFPLSIHDGFQVEEHWATTRLRERFNQQLAGLSQEKTLVEQALDAANVRLEQERQDRLALRLRTEQVESGWEAERTRVGDLIAERATALADLSRSEQRNALLEQHLDRLRREQLEFVDRLVASNSQLTSTTQEKLKLEGALAEFRRAERETSTANGMRSEVDVLERDGALEPTAVSAVSMTSESTDLMNAPANMQSLPPIAGLISHERGRAQSLDQLLSLPPIDFVHAAYQTLLGRTADEPGLQDYLAQLSLGRSRVEVLQSLASSAEFRRRQQLEDLENASDIDFVTEAYRRLLGRPLDQSGEQNYLKQLGRGWERSRVLKDIADSEEARRRLNSPTDLLGQIQLLLRREGSDRSRGWLGDRGRRVERRVSQLDLTLTTTLARLQQQVEALSGGADVRTAQQAQLELQQPNGIGELRPRRWTPRTPSRADAETESRQRAVEPTPVHPDVAELRKQMIAQGPHGRFSSPAEGCLDLDDYLTGAWPPEDSDRGRVRWIGKFATAHLHVTGRTLHIVAAGLFKPRAAYVSMNGVMLGRAEFESHPTHVQLPVDQWVGRDVAMQLRCVAVYNPREQGVGSDARDLGLQIQSVYFS